jgi:hypothetical protein
MWMPSPVGSMMTPGSGLGLRIDAGYATLIFATWWEELRPPRGDHDNLR